MSTIYDKDNTETDFEVILDNIFLPVYFMSMSDLLQVGGLFIKSENYRKPQIYKPLTWAYVNFCDYHIIWYEYEISR